MRQWEPVTLVMEWQNSERVGWGGLKRSGVTKRRGEGGRLFHHSISHSLQSCGGIWEIAHWKTTKQKRLYGCHLWLRLGWFTGNNPMCILNTKIIEIKHCRVKRKGGGTQPYWAYFLYCFWYLCLQPASIRTESGFQYTALRSITKRLDYVRKQHRLNSSVCTICSTTSEIRT